MCIRDSKTDALGFRFENGRFWVNQDDLTRLISGKKEEAIFSYLYERSNQICDIKEIFEYCWKQPFEELAENNRETVQQTVSRLRKSIQKLNKNIGKNLITTYTGKGYQLNN